MSLITGSGDFAGSSVADAGKRSPTVVGTKVTGVDFDITNNVVNDTGFASTISGLFPF